MSSDAPRRKESCPVSGHVLKHRGSSHWHRGPTQRPHHQLALLQECKRETCGATIEVEINELMSVLMMKYQLFVNNVLVVSIVNLI